jgi:hypothetical protein
METPTLWQRLLWPKLPAKPEPVAPGLYHYFEDEGGQYTRFHLRVEPDGSGMLLANATTAARLSPTGVVIARDLLEGEPETAVFAHLKEQFKGTDEAIMQADLQQVQAILQQLIAPTPTTPSSTWPTPTLTPTRPNCSPRWRPKFRWPRPTSLCPCWTACGRLAFPTPPSWLRPG